jgi:glutathione S-transferase
MNTLLYSAASPYSAKARMAAKAAGVEIEAKTVNTNDEPDTLLAANPLGKIPVLIAEDGIAIYDSRAITQHLNRLCRGAIFPRNAAKRAQAERLEALADGICDCALAHVYERRFRPEELIHQGWLDKQWGKVERALDHLASDLPRLTAKPHVGLMALRAALGYLELRFEGKWEKKRGKLIRWAKRFDERYPELADLAPRG